MRNIKLRIEYDGTDFVGWQRQAIGRSVQGDIESVLNTITGETITLVGAGRTDSGVHARGQTANFKTMSQLGTHEIMRALNGLLADDVVIHSVDEVDEQFSARYSATERMYRYYISRTPTAFERKYCWQLGYSLDVSKMNEASSLLFSIKNYQSFCKVEANVEHYLCDVKCAEWSNETDSKLIFTIRANRFLHGMVRALVGTLVNVGRGFTSQREFQNIIQSHDRSNAGQSAPAHGLFLEEVIY